MKCENCGHLCTDGYEYPESYCELYIAENPEFKKYDTGEGCTLTKKQRVKRCKELEEKGVCLWWDESEVKDETNII